MCKFHFDAPSGFLGIQRLTIHRSPNRTVLTVDLDHDLVVIAVVFPGCGNERRLDRLNDDLFVNVLVAMDRVNDP